MTMGKSKRTLNQCGLERLMNKYKELNQCQL